MATRYINITLRHFDPVWQAYITKETKWHPLCRCHDNSYAAGPVLIKTNITRFHLKQGSSTPNNLMGRVKSIWESCVFQARPSVPFRRVARPIVNKATARHSQPQVPWTFSTIVLVPSYLWILRNCPYSMLVMFKKESTRSLSSKWTKTLDRVQLHCIKNVWVTVIISSQKKSF